MELKIPKLFTDIFDSSNQKDSEKSLEKTVGEFLGIDRRTIRLVIYYKSGRSLYSEVSFDKNEYPNAGYLTVFKDFYKWWFLRKSEYFLLEGKGKGIGKSIILIRSEIKHLEFIQKDT